MQLKKGYNSLISVVLPVYNQEKYIAETICSVINQTYTDFELLILDDGSTDASAEIIREYSKKDKRIVASFQNNSGRAIATNRLVEKAKGVWCFFLDADDLLLRDTLEKRMNFHNENPKLHGSSCHCIYINHKGEQIGIQRYPFLKTIGDCKKAKENNEMVLCSFGGLMTTKHCYLETGGLRSHIWPGDDFDIINRFIERGYLLLIQQEALYKYRRHQNSDSIKFSFKMYNMNDYITYCATLRRSGKKEISFEDFKEVQSKYPFWKIFNSKKHFYSVIYFRDGTYALGEKKYIFFFLIFYLVLFYRLNLRLQ